MPKPAKRFNRFYIASLDEVRVTRDGESAIIEYLEGNVLSRNLQIGPEIDQMTDQEILDRHNDHIRAAGEIAHEYRNKPLVEVPLNKPQVDYFEAGDQWCPRGDVLRCIITVDEETGETAFVIDDQEFSLEEFGTMLKTREGWGMRISFVEEDELHRQPRVEMREPED